MAEQEVVLEWGNKQQTELDSLAKEYFDIDMQIKILSDKKSVIKETIGKLMTAYAQKKVVTENFSVGYSHVNGSRNFNAAVAKAELIKLNVELTDRFYKISNGYDRLDINKVEPEKEDPHQVKVTLEDLKI